MNKAKTFYHHEDCCEILHLILWWPDCNHTIHSLIPNPNRLLYGIQCWVSKYYHGDQTSSEINCSHTREMNCFIDDDIVISSCNKKYKPTSRTTTSQKCSRIGVIHFVIFLHRTVHYELFFSLIKTVKPTIRNIS